MRSFPSCLVAECVGGKEVDKAMNFCIKYLYSLLSCETFIH